MRSTLFLYLHSSVLYILSVHHCIRCSGQGSKFPKTSRRTASPTGCHRFCGRPILSLLGFLVTLLSVLLSTSPPMMMYRMRVWWTCEAVAVRSRHALGSPASGLSTKNPGADDFNGLRLHVEGYRADTRYILPWDEEQCMHTVACVVRLTYTVVGLTSYGHNTRHCPHVAVVN